MKLFSKYMFVALLSILALASCSDDDKYVAGAQDAADNAGVYFPVIDGGDNEVDPSDPTEFTFKVDRMNTKGTLSVPLTVKSNDDNIFEIPATAEFADGEAETTVKVTFPQAEVGVTYAMEVEIPEQYVSLYKENAGNVSYATSYTRVKWEDAGVGYFVDGIFTPMFGGDFTMAVELQKTVSTDGKVVRYRFDSPYAYLCTGQDELGGYIGYPYNEEGDCDEQSHKIVISIEKGEDGYIASMAQTYTGMNWAGYGKFTIGQTRDIVEEANKDNYDLGVYTPGEGELPGSIKWSADGSSLFFDMSEYNGGYTGLQNSDTYLFLSADDYKAYLDSLPTEE